MLTAAEKKWLACLQEVLDACPSKRLGFYTIGDQTVEVYDKRRDAKIDAVLESRGASDFGPAVSKCKAHLGSISFPSQVHSTAA
ncbi:hypothetical protein [Paracoccus sp. SY]|uniref:hypothetical protein n=1 Tax=Paracoccus sp. SY TaxID=1330255 RepID=UPI000CD067BB|nr:hypothetical protein [Paracoccus sp. SY]